MKRFKITQVLALLFAIGAVAIAKQPTGKLSGVVVDITGARVAGTKITIEGDRETRLATTAEDGSYNIELPTGVYRMKVRSTGFCPTRRAAFRVQPATSKSFDFTLVVCPIVNTLSIKKGRYTGETDSYRLPFKEESFVINSSGLPLNLLIQFGKRWRNKGIVHYTGSKLDSGKLLKVVASYDSLTIHAVKVRFNPKTLYLEAAGDVVVEDSRQSIQAERVLVDLQTKEPVMKVSPKDR